MLSLIVQFRAVVIRREYTMNPKETKRFDILYQRHLQMLKLQGKSEKTQDAYARAIRRLRDHFDCCPDKLTPKQLESYFAQLVETHSWSTVKVDCWGFKFFWKFVLEKDLQWINIVKPPKVKSLPDILTPSEIEQYSNLAKNLGLEVILEVHDEEELNRSLFPSIDVVGINNRNLKTFEVSIETSIDLASKIPASYCKISESGLDSPEAIKRLIQYGFEGFLMGEHFMKTNNPGKALSQILAAL